MKNLLYFLLLSCVLRCAAASPAASQPRDLRFTFDLHDPAHIHVTLDLVHNRPGPEVLLLPSHWAGQTELYRAVSHLQITSPQPNIDPALAPTADPALWLLHTRSPGPVTITYDLAQDWSGPLRHPFEHRAILRPDLFEFNGENGLVTPAISAASPVDVTFDFIGLPQGQTLVTSFGAGTHQHFAGPWSGVRNALFTGGRMSTRTLDVGSHPVLLALYGQWSFPIDRIAADVGKILDAERHLWNDTAVPQYSIVIAPYDDPHSGGGGSGFTDISNLFLADREHFTADTASLLAHEAFHYWNPAGLGTVADTQQIAWFGEGFTRFYQDTVLEHAGLLTPSEYLTRLNLTIREYSLSPRINATQADLERMPAADQFAYQEPYLRGAMIALWLSSEIDRQTGGTLTDLMLALRDGRAEPLTADRIFRTASRFVDPATVARTRAFALDGVTVPVPEGSLGECVAVRGRPAWTFDLGFDTASLHRAGIVQGVEQGSNAWQAGVRDGLQLGGFSLWNGNPEREVTLTLRGIDGRRERLTFLPRGKRFEIPQAEQIPGCPQGPRIPQ